MDDIAKDIIQTWERLDGDRGTWKSHWQEIGNYMLPNRNDYITRRTPGQKRTQYIFDSTPLVALEQFAAGMHGLLTSPSLQWFAMKAEDDGLNTRDDVRAWLDDATKTMYGIFNGPGHNFASQSHELYLDIGSVGTAVMAVLESKRKGMLFSTRHLKECVIAENEEDRVDTLVRKWHYTAKQAVEAWGSAAGEKVLKAYDEKPDTSFEFMHSVRPRRDRNPERRDAKHKAFESCYISVADGAVIQESGFDEFPYLVPRFSKATGEIYGRGPGSLVLADVKMLNEMRKTILKGAQKVIDPPLMVPDDGFMTPIKTVPGSLNYYRAGSNDRIEPVETKGQVQLGIDMLGGLQQQIKQGFYVEWLMMPSDPNDPSAAGKGITATYVLQQRDEKMRLLSPMLARLQAEFLGPLIDRVFAILWRQSVRLGFGPGSPFLPPPAALSGVNLRVEYVSPVALAQKSSQMDAVGRLLQLVQAVMQVDPNAAMVLDTEAMLRLAANDLNTPAAILKSPERLAQDKAAKQQADEAMQQHMQLESLAKTAKDGSAAMQNMASAGALAGAAGGGQGGGVGQGGAGQGGAGQGAVPQGVAA
ncbi:MAG TPA: portal protein [Stellaceae bacterium]|nr:portal protein [Stellaceae bacterium]